MFSYNAYLINENNKKNKCISIKDKIKNAFLNSLTQVSFEIIKCYKNILDFNNFKYSLGFYKLNIFFYFN